MYSQHQASLYLPGPPPGNYNRCASLESVGEAEIAGYKDQGYIVVDLALEPPAVEVLTLSQRIVAEPSL